jgi:branched-chain amino acid transport system ATP-binding protein
VGPPVSDLLEVKDLSSGYGRLQVLHSLSLRVADGEHVGLFGPNGHGKTTLLRTISGLLRAWSGQIHFRDTRISNTEPRRIVDMGLVHVPQANTLFPRMTVFENLTMGAYTKRVWEDRETNLERVYSLFPKLKQRRSQLCRTLSGGERQMVSIGMGLMGNPRLLMLDEPTLGLAPKIKEELKEAIHNVAATGVSLVIVDQDVELLLAVSDRLYLIEQGRVALESQKGEAEAHELDDAHVLQMYFGKARA